VPLGDERRDGLASPPAMTAFLAFAIIAGVLSAVTWLVLRVRRLERDRDFERKVHARKSGWTYDRQRSGRIDYRFAGTVGGIEWQMWHDSDRGADSPTPRAYWTSANLRTRGLALVIIGRRRFQLESGTVGRLLMGVVTGVAHAVTGHAGQVDKADFYESAIEIKVGRPAFDERLTVAVAPDMPRAWVDDELQALLLDWPATGTTRMLKGEDNLEITLRADGLKIVVQKMPQDIAHWRHLARLGEHLAHRLAQTEAR
jgi:hypothetical protein